MAECHEMRKGEVYVCADCGLELQVTKECRDAEGTARECGCSSSGCDISCCGKGLVKKGS